MSEKQLVRDLLGLYYVGRSHGKKCECPTCEAWDKVEQTPEAVLSALENMVKPSPEG